MSFRKALFLFSLIAAAACPAAGYSLAGSWIGAGLAILLPLVLLFPRGFSAIWLPTFFLGGEVFLAAAGLLEGAPDLLMILGAAAALAAWDLAHLDRLLRKSVSSPAAGHMERAHLRCMLLALDQTIVAT
ncbi:MAG: hypothetical protein M1281_16595, partial [Chloroflexi bacterium]|nr:hypothetical protein [Chloroflexota bacterium]